MIGQKTINSFFSPVSKKRTSTELNESEEDANDPKKQKACETETEQNSPRPAPLSPEQLERIARNKKAALEKLVSAQTPPGFGESWRKALSAEFGKPYFKQLTNFVSEERKRYTVYPPAEHVFTWTQMCHIRDGSSTFTIKRALMCKHNTFEPCNQSFNTSQQSSIKAVQLFYGQSKTTPAGEYVKVVILGQDPYHGPNQAHGLCFSVKRPVPPPPSLENMFKELSSDIEGFQHPGHGDLTGWAEQGVLLLNAVLTVRAHQANSHKDRGWEAFTDAVVQWLSKNQEGLIFMLWGSYAQKKGAAIDRKRHHVLQAVHPSPLSAHRGFFGCRHFSKANELLQKSGKSPIDWKAL